MNGQTTRNAALMLAALATSSARAQTYWIREIPPGSGGGYTYAWDINSDGVVMGARELPSGLGTEVVFYDDDGLKAVMAAPPGDAPLIWPGAINDGGTFVGMEVGPNPPLGTTRRSFVSAFQFLPDRFVLFAQIGPTGGTDINNASPTYSVGQMGIGQYMKGYMIEHAFRVKTDGLNNPPIDLGTLGGPYSRAEAINDAGDVVGVSLTAAGPFHAFIVPNNSAMIDLGTLGGVMSLARDINNAGVVVGWSRLADGSARAFRWQAGTMEALDRLGDYAEANGINAAGEIVGMSMDGQGRPRAVLFDGASVIDLNTRIPAGSGWVLQYAEAINDAGLIVGRGRRNGETRGFILARCAADCDASGSLDIDDFVCFQTYFAIGDAKADCDGSGTLDIEDFICYQTLFAVGC